MIPQWHRCLVNGKAVGLLFDLSPVRTGCRLHHSEGDCRGGRQSLEAIWKQRCRAYLKGKKFPSNVMILCLRATTVCFFLFLFFSMSIVPTGTMPSVSYINRCSTLHDDGILWCDTSFLLCFVKLTYAIAFFLPIFLHSCHIKSSGCCHIVVFHCRAGICHSPGMSVTNKPAHRTPSQQSRCAMCGGF